MAGYCGFSKSNRAVWAEEAGKMTASAAAAELRRRFRRLAGLTAADVAAVLRPCEWHHTSCRYNRTDYFDLEDVEVPGVLAKLWLKARARREAKKAGPVVLANCTVKWLEWGGTRAHPRAYDREEVGCTVTFKPKAEMMTVKTADGREFRKALWSRGTEVYQADGRRVLENPAGGGK